MAKREGMKKRGGKMARVCRKGRRTKKGREEERGRRGVLRTPRVERVGTVPAAAKVAVNSPFLFIASDLVAGVSDDFS